MAEQYNNGETFASVRSKLNEAIRQLNTSRRDWFSGFDGPRCYFGGKAYDLASGGDSSHTPGDPLTNSWVEVAEFTNGGASGGGQTVNPAITSPTSSTINSPTMQLVWSWGSGATPTGYAITVQDDGTTVLSDSGPGTNNSYVINGLPLDGSQINVTLVLNYANGTNETLQATYTTTSSVVEPVWLSPATGFTISGSTVTPAWNFGSRTPSTWTMTVTNVDTSTVLQTLNGTTANNQQVNGLPDDGSNINFSVAITFTDGTVKTVGATITNGTAASTMPALSASVTGATVSGTVSVSGAVPDWITAGTTASGQSQSGFPASGGSFTVDANGGSVTGIEFPNAGLTSLVLDSGVAPVSINLDTNPSLVLNAGDIDFSSAQYINLKDTGAGTVIGDSDVTPSIIKELNLCNAPGSTITGGVIGQMIGIEKLCLQALGTALTDADMNAGSYPSMQQFQVGFNGNINITETTIRKMQSLELLHARQSGSTVTPAWFISAGGSPYLSSIQNIDIQEQVSNVPDMDNILTNIRNTADTFGINNGTLQILNGNPAPSNGNANADILALQARGWAVT